MPAGEIHELKELGCVVLQQPACGPITPLASACQQQALYINPLNDCHVLAGMGTVGLEILQQIKDVKNLEAVFCSARAGGALEAIGIAIKLFAPQVKVIGVGFQSSAAASSPSFSISIVDSVASQAPEGTSPNSINGLNVLPVQKNWLTLSEQLETSTTSSHTEEEATSEATRIHPSVVHEIMFVEPYDMSQAMEDVFVEFRVLIDADGSLAVAGLKRHALSKGLGMEAPSLVAIISSTNLFVSSNSCNPTVKMNNNYVRHDAGIERLT
jgi:threonine dehydratase